MMASMKPLSSVLGSTLRDSAAANELAAKAARTNRVHQMWRSSVDQVMLDHTNAVYIIDDHGRKVLIVYVDESIFAAELNARRELIKLKFLQQFHENLDEFRVCISRGSYKGNHPFRDERDERGDAVIRHRVPLSAEREHMLRAQCEAIGDDRLREALLKAMISDLEWKNGDDAEKIKNTAL